MFRAGFCPGRAWQGYRFMTRQLDARLARELARTSGLSMQDYDVLSALADVADHRWCAKDLGSHLLWSPSRLSHRNRPGSLPQPRISRAEAG